MYERFPAKAGVTEWGSLATVVIWWGLDAMRPTEHKWTLLFPTAFLLYEVWKLWGAYYELQELALFKRVGIMSETIPYANIMALRRQRERNRLAFLRHEYLELEYRTSKGNVLTAKLSPTMMDDFVTQLEDRMGLASYRSRI